MKLPTREQVVKYFKGQALSQFVGFYVGMSSTGLVSHFFETRSISNLWGILASKPIVDAQTFNILERIVAVVIGFVVFEIVSKNLKPFFEHWKPIVVEGISRCRKEQAWDDKVQTAVSIVRQKSVSIYASVRTSLLNFSDRHKKK